VHRHAAARHGDVLSDEPHRAGQLDPLAVDEKPGVAERRADLRVLGDPGDVLAEGSTGLVVPRGGRLVALVGVDDVVVVDTPDAVLVTTRDRAQDVKTLVDRLRDLGRDDLT